MLLPHVQEAIDKAPHYVAGVSFSDRTIRYIEVEREDGVLTLSSFGQQTIPYDTVRNGTIIDPISFTDTVKRLTNYLHKDALVVIKEDGDSAKAETLALAGFKTIGHKKSPDLLKGIFAPWGVHTKRLCLFANYDQTFVFLVSKDAIEKIDSLTEKELFSLKGSGLLDTYLKDLDNKDIVFAGKYKDDTFLDRLNDDGYQLVEASIWQNLFDFNRYIPEIPHEEAYVYTVPAGLVVSGIMENLRRYNTKKQKQTAAIAPPDTDAFDFSEQHQDLSDAFADFQPLTKLHEDHKLPSEK